MIFSGLIRVNQDFREVTKMFDPSQVQVLLYEHEKGPFAGETFESRASTLRECREKNRLQHLPQT
jgi:hypothetical protein